MSKKTNIIDVNLLTDAQRKALRDGINLAVVQKQHIKDLSNSLKEHTKELAEQFGIEVSSLNTSINSIINQDFFKRVEKQDQVESILTVSGLLAQAESDSE